MRLYGLILLVASLALSVPSEAQVRELQAKAGKDWKHKDSGVKLPASLAGLSRDDIRAYAGAETDVGTNYWSADRSENVTIFLFRNVSADAPVWFDRARSLILLQPTKYANPQSTGIRAFTPRGQARASGLIEIFSTQSQFRSTGVILFPVNGFYAKIRASSNTRDAAALEQLMLSAANSIGWSSRQREASMAVAVQDCASPLPQRSPAKPATLSKDDRMMSALLGGVVAQAVDLKGTPAAALYCREPGALAISYGVYRSENSTERYLMALLDSGRAISVGNSVASQILSELKTSPRFSVSHIELDQIRTYGDFESLPLPAQALEMVMKSRPSSVAHTWGGQKRTLSINMGE